MTDAKTTVQPSARRLRVMFAATALLSLIAVFYLSAIPLRYKPIPLSETWERFWQIPWLNLSLERRADWVANGLVLIPFGFFFTGALHYRRGSLRHRQASLIAFALLQAIIVSAIEAMQIWFPPRVLSRNDMLAGYLGGIAGLFLWHAIGHRVVEFTGKLGRTPKGLPRLYAATCAGLIALLGYSLLPLDVMVTAAEWHAKYRSGRFLLVPFGEWNSLGTVTRELVLNGWVIPVAIVFTASLGSRARAFYHLVPWCVAIELVSLPLYSVTTSITDILVRLVYAAIGVAIARPLVRLTLAADRSVVWFVAAFIWMLILMAVFLVRGDSVLMEPSLIRERLEGIFTAPFARAQRSSEMVAAQNLLGKTVLFAVLGFLLYGGVDRCRDRNRKIAGVIAAMFAGSVAVGIEVAQVFLPPRIADVTDLLMYSLGLAAGVGLYQMLVPTHKQPGRPRPDSPRGR